MIFYLSHLMVSQQHVVCALQLQLSFVKFLKIDNVTLKSLSLTIRVSPPATDPAQGHGTGPVASAETF